MTAAGRIWGVGVGPGDPQLLTLKAYRIVTTADVIAYPAPEDGNSLARSIVAPHLPGGQEEIAIRIPLDARRFPPQDVYRRAGAAIGARAASGRSVAVLCEGDPFFFGSFMYLFGVLSRRWPVEVVPGVSSLTAGAAALGLPLAGRNDVVTIIPATLGAAEIAARLDGADMAVFIKVGRHLGKVRRALAQAGLLASARYIERATMAAERTMPLAEAPDDAAPYFSMVFAHRRERSGSHAFLPTAAAAALRPLRRVAGEREGTHRASDGEGEVVSPVSRSRGRRSGIPHLTPALSAPGGGEGEKHASAIYESGRAVTGGLSNGAGPVFVALTQPGADLARRLGAEIPGSALHGLDGRVAGADLAFASVGDHLRSLYGEGRPIIGVFSTGIMVRSLAGRLADKVDAPPVVCVSEDGSAVVPLLGGHHGANELAACLARALGVPPAITTAGEARFGLALDDPPAGWTVSGVEAAKPVMADLLAGRAVRLVSELDPGIDTAWITEAGAPFTAAAAHRTVRLTERARPAGDAALCLHPRTLVLGVGCERGVADAELSDLVAETLAAAGWAPGAVACVATIDLKEDEPAIRDLADALGVPLRLFTAARLETETPRLASPSDTVFAAVGCHGVAEAAALACAGPEAGLAVPKAKSARATCAVARAPAIVVAEAAGRAPGLLSIIGIGPGQSDWRAPAATGALAQATDIVAYGLYLDLIGDLARHRTLHRYALGEERDRCIRALDLAAEGKRVALVSSGDAGIYAMASLVFELIDRDDRGDWRRLAVEVVPGISALQALAARSGAPLGHDFCAISLSDLMTPWPVIENRLRAAAAGDFVVALYNPVSRRRTTQLARARDILLEARPPATPVVLGRDLGRAGEHIDFITLDELDAARVDMLTTVLIGSRATRFVGGCRTARRVYTPRGYGRQDAKP